ncbi:MAG: MFS transporter [Pseudonocardiaceae bacterium]
MNTAGPPPCHPTRSPNTYVGTDLFVVSPLLHMWGQTFHVSISTAGLAVTAFAVAYVLGAPFLGGLADRLSRRKILLFALLSFALANLITALTPWFSLLIVARLAAGLSVAGTTPSVYALVSENSPNGRRAAWLGITTSGLLSALWAGAPLGDLAAAHFGWRAVFFTLVAAAASVMVVNRVIWAERPTPDTGTEQRATTLRRARAVSTTTLWAAGVYGLYTYLVSGLHAEGWGTNLTAAALAVYGVCAVAGSLFGGRVADHSHPLRMVTTGLASLAVALVMVGLVVRESVPLTLAALGVMALAAYPVFPAQQAELLRCFPPAESARILAWNQSAMYVGIAAGSLFGGAVISGPGFGFLPFICAAVALMGVAASRVATRIPAQSHAETPNKVDAA